MEDSSTMSEFPPFISFVNEILGWQGETITVFLRRSVKSNSAKFTRPLTFLKLANSGSLKKLHLFISLLLIRSAL